MKAFQFKPITISVYLLLVASLTACGGGSSDTSTGPTSFTSNTTSTLTCVNGIQVRLDLVKCCHYLAAHEHIHWRHVLSVELDLAERGGCCGGQRPAAKSWATATSAVATTRAESLLSSGLRCLAPNLSHLNAADIDEGG